MTVYYDSCDSQSHIALEVWLIFNLNSVSFTVTLCLRHDLLPRNCIDEEVGRFHRQRLDNLQFVIWIRKLAVKLLENHRESNRRFLHCKWPTLIITVR
jgi:hypothetical protein